MNAFWDASIFADRQMEQDPAWADSEEGKACLGIVHNENVRLSNTVFCLKCGKPIDYREGTCPHCGYKEF